MCSDDAQWVSLDVCGDGAAAERDIAADRPLAELLPAVLDRLFAVHEPETCRLHVELMAIRDQLVRLGSSERQRVEQVCEDVPRALAAVVASLPRRCAAKRVPPDVRALVTRLRCVIEITQATGAPPPELAVRYAALDLARLVRRVGSAFDELARARRLGYSIRAPQTARIEADAAKIEMVLLNLLFNAFKHTPEAGVIDCSVAVDSGEVSVRVTDGGGGIDAEQADAIFDRARVDDRSAVVTIDGLGLSLARSRDLVALHGGSLSLAEGEGPGATFEARFPARAPMGVEIREPPESLGAITHRAAEVATRELQAEALIGTTQVERAGRPLVLVVEENRPIQRLLAEALEPTYATAAALDGAAGYRLALEHEPDLVIVDTSLPDVHGESLIRSLRARGELAHVPILALTSGGDAHGHVRILECGAQDLVRKPFLLQELYVRTRNLVATKQTRDVLGEAARRHETDIVALAGEVSRKQRDLERAVAEVQVARELAENGNRVKSNFLRMVSHELKTPVTAMQLQMLVLERHEAELRAPQLRRPLQSIGRSIRKLLTTVDTTIEWARIEAGRCQLSVEDIDLAAVTERAVAVLADHATHKGLELELVSPNEALPVLRSDARIVRLVLANLLTRAVALSEEGDVEVRVDHEESAHRIRVRDSAPILAPAERRSIFEPLNDMDLRWQTGQGSGLGLAVVRDIARAARGDVWLDDACRDGNAFVVTLPSLSE